MSSSIKGMNANCHICYAKSLELFPDYHCLPRVASDCVPWRSGGHLAICSECSCVQNPVDETWHKEVSEIYSRYKIYRQSAGSEQSVFCENKPLMPRSARVFNQARAYLDLTKPERLLDIGCANGELLRCFSQLAPHWKMVGFEIDEKCRREVESIPGVEAFISGSLDQINQTFDLITLMHVFEHLPYPTEWLKKLRKLLTPNGFIFIQVPDPKQNPYNLLVADHCSHFILRDLIQIAQKETFEIVAHSDQWVLREFSLLIKPAKDQIASKKIQAGSHSTYPQNSLRWLHDIVRLAKSFPKDKQRGIWGTAIAGTWLYSIMDDEVDFFVDEDANRIGQKHLGKPIYSPNQVPKESNIFVALTPEIASSIVNRWSHLQVSLHPPPKLIY